MNLTMIFYQGMFLIGKMDHPKLFNPRTYSLIQTGPNQYKHGLTPLPGQPLFITLPKEVVYWSVMDKEIESLYVQSTSGIKLVTTVPRMQ